MRLALFVLLIATPAFADDRVSLDYAPAPVDNPLKGLVPYQADVRALFPHSLEFNYLPYSVLVKGYDQYDWTPMENLLDDIASRGHQAVLRIFLEYPGKEGRPPRIPPERRPEGDEVVGHLVIRGLAARHRNARL